VDILIVVLSALVAALVVLAAALLWVASRHDRATSELSSPPPREQSLSDAEAPASGARFRRRSRTRASTPQ
jgi:Flp pilus assembly protein TadB